MKCAANGKDSGNLDIWCRPPDFPRFPSSVILLQGIILMGREGDLAESIFGNDEALQVQLYFHGLFKNLFGSCEDRKCSTSAQPQQQY